MEEIVLSLDFWANFSIKVVFFRDFSSNTYYFKKMYEKNESLAKNAKVSNQLEMFQPSSVKEKRNLPLISVITSAIPVIIV